MKNRSDKKTFRWWKIPLCLLTLAVLVVLGYVAYVVLTYSRIEDNQVLEVQGSAKEAGAGSDQRAHVCLRNRRVPGGRPDANAGG